jgi:hypothetical protein
VYADFERVMLEQEDDARVPLRYYALTDLHRERVAIVRIDRHWATFRRSVRNGLLPFSHTYTLIYAHAHARARMLRSCGRCRTCTRDA